MNADTLELAPIEGVTAATEPTLKETALASFVPIEAHIAALALRYRDVAFETATPKGMNAAKAARLELREDGRYAVQRLQKRLKSEANDLKRVVDDKSEALIKIIEPVEDAIHQQIEAEEKRKADEKAERERIEAERKAGHEAFIATIRAYLTHCQQPGMTSARIEAGMKALQAVTIGPEREEYAVPAANAQCETLEAMRVLYAQTLGREQEAERQARIAEENRLQAEANAREAARIAAEAEELRRQAAELQRLKDEAAARERAAAEAEQRAREQEAARIAAQQADEARETDLIRQLDQEAGTESARIVNAAAAHAAQGTAEGQTGPATDVPYVATLVFDTETRTMKGVMLADAEPAPIVPVAPAGEPATLTLGEICTRLDPDGGCRLTAAFLADRLHITPAKTAPNGGKLFTESQFQQLCDQAARHFSAMAELYAPETA